MNKLTCSILFTTIFWATSSFAGESLASACSAYGGKLLRKVTIENYNFNTIESQFNIRTSRSAYNWYSVAGNNNSGILYDIAKTARLTGESVDVCVNTTGNHFLGIEWTNAAN